MRAQSRYLRCAGRELHYLEWGAAHAPAVIAWHGLARTGRDFDDMAEHLSDRYRVICPDTVGRGLSQWSPEPQAEYQLSFYARLAVDLMDQLGIGQAHWVGTSMGGAIGMVAAAGLGSASLRGRLQSLLLNDIAPELAESALTRIKSYAGSPPAFEAFGELEAFFRTVYKPFGWLSDAQWRRLAETSARRLPDGRFTPHYDPAMVRQFTDHPNDYLRWTEWDALDLPVLLLHGAESDLVRPEIVAQMRVRGPGARGRLQVIEVPNVGHAPALNRLEQFAWVSDFLGAHGL